MAIYIGGYLTNEKLNKGEGSKEPEAKKRVITEADMKTTPMNTEKYVKSEPRSYSDSEQYIVVNGKPKKISKHSQYLVDMLTTEE